MCAIKIKLSKDPTDLQWKDKIFRLEFLGSS